MENVVLTAPDITCAHCQRAIETDLGVVKGIGSVKVDIPTKQVHISYDPQQVNVESIRTALDEAGYPVAG